MVLPAPGVATARKSEPLGGPELLEGVRLPPAESDRAGHGAFEHRSRRPLPEHPNSTPVATAATTVAGRDRRRRRSEPRPRRWVAEQAPTAPPDWGAIMPPGTPRPGHGVAAAPPRRRLRRHPLARAARAAVGSPSTTSRPGSRCAPTPASRPSSTWSASCSPAARSSSSAPTAQQARAPAAHGPRRAGVVPVVLRARRRLRPRLARRPGAERRRRRLGRQRPEGVVLGRAGVRLGHPARPHRTRRPAKHAGISFFVVDMHRPASRPGRCAR